MSARQDTAHHLCNGFDDTETAAVTTATSMKTCRADRVVVRDDRARCEHAGCCGNAGLAVEAADITLVSGSLAGW